MNLFFLLMIAGFTKNKRHEVAIRAMATLTADDPFHLAIAGDGGKLKQQLQDLARELGVSNRVHFLGYRTDIQELLTAADVQLLISKREGLPRSVMEGLAFNKKIIGTRIRGIQDLLQDGVGILLDECTPSALAQAFKSSMTFEPNDERRLEVLERCSLKNILEEHEKLYGRLLNFDAQKDKNQETPPTVPTSVSN